MRAIPAMLHCQHVRLRTADGSVLLLLLLLLLYVKQPATHCCLGMLL